MSFNFGGTSTTGSSGFSFGGGTGTSGTGGGFSFGGSTGSTGAASSTTGGSGFSFGGSKPATGTTGTGGGFSFGGNSSGTTGGAAASTTGGGGFSFGGSKPATTGTGGGFSFGGSSGGSSTGGGFGGSSTGGGFGGFGGGASTSSGGGGFSFGNTGSSSTTTTTGFGGGFGGGQPGQPAAGNPVQAQIQSIKEAYTPTHDNCKFKLVLYNKLPEGKINEYKAPGGAGYTVPQYVDKRLWEQAVKNNPDPQHLVPTQLVGFEELKTRISKQEECIRHHKQTIEAERKTIEDMRRCHEVMRNTISETRQEHDRLAHRLLRVMSSIEVERSKTYPYMNQEIDYHKKLQNLERRLEKPGQFKSKVAELQSLVARAPDGRGTDQTYLKLDTETKTRLFSFLETQKKALNHLTQTIQTDLTDMNVVQQGLSQESRFSQSNRAQSLT